jgi:hypothetical protein
VYEANQDREVAGLVDLIRKCRAKPAAVMLVLMPEHSRFRSMTPPFTKPFLVGAVRKAFPSSELPIVDFQSAIADDGFDDYVHLGDKGADEFSRLLGHAIRDHFPAADEVDLGDRSCRRWRL